MTVRLYQNMMGLLSMNRLPFAVPALLLMAIGCARLVQTEYRKPALQVPGRWAEGGGSESAPTLDQTAWWKAFADPVLDGLMDQALKGSLDLRQAQARIVQARAELTTAKAAQAPTVTASASATRGQTSQNSLSAYPYPYTQYQAGFDAAWEFVQVGGLAKGREKAQALYEASLEDLNATRLTLLGDVARYYITLRSCQAQLEITRGNAEVQGRSADLTEQRYEAGLVGRLDAAQARTQAAQTRAQIPVQQALVQQAIHRLGILLGQTPEALEGGLSTAKPLPRCPAAGAAGLPAELLARRPDLRRKERQLAAAMADVGVARADLYPTFDLTLGLGLESLGSSHFARRSSRYWDIVPGLSLPVFTRGRLKAAVTRKQAVYDEQLAGFQAAYHGALEDVENALSSCYTDRARRQDLEEALEESRLAADLAEQRYRQGLTGFLDVLSAQSARYTAESALSQSRADLLTDYVSLYKSLGGGWNTGPGPD
ncbi:MAG: efflux transporter outer membrane subunit [Holophaga sp.]|nr:efflux transporter outer membrane subunit [Holophaga sp.]